MPPEWRVLVCGAHSTVFFGSEIKDPRDLEYPSVRYKDKWPERWMVSDDKKVSPDGSLVAVCPECGDKLGPISGCSGLRLEPIRSRRR